MQAEMFPSGEDLPLFSGAPVRAQPGNFQPATSVKQDALFDLRPDPFQMKPESPDDQPNPDGADAAGDGHHAG